MARGAVDLAVAMDAAGFALKATTELLRCTGDADVAADLQARLDALRETHHGVDLDDADDAMAEYVTAVTGSAP